MNKKDSQVLKDSALVVADQIASVVPGLNIAWGLSKAVYGAGLKIREQKALEWVEMVRDNPELFTAQLLEQEEFQDTFVYTLEKYICERDEEKRKIIKSIFLGYTSADDRKKFELERLINTLSLVSYDGMRLLRMLKPLIPTTNPSALKLSDYLGQYLIEDANSSNRQHHPLPGQTNVREIWADAETDLISIGLLRSYTVARWGDGENDNPYDYNLSKHGEKFIEYISK